MSPVSSVKDFCPTPLLREDLGLEVRLLKKEELKSVRYLTKDFEDKYSKEYIYI